MTNNSLLIAVVGACLCIFPQWANAGEVSNTKNNIDLKTNESGNVADFLSTRLVKPSETGFHSVSLKPTQNPSYLVLYFSAHWCPACKKITPRLVEFYEEQRKRHDNFEFVFVSSDRSEEDMRQYMTGYRMPWAALKFSEKIENKSILKHAGRGIPCIVVVDNNGIVVASSFEDGKYQGPMKPVETLARILDDERAQRALAVTR